MFRTSMLVILLAQLISVALGCGSGEKMQPASTVPATGNPQTLWSPISGDLRFQGIGAYTSSVRFLGSGFSGGITRSFPSYAGTPLQIGSGVCGPIFERWDCYWFFSVHGPPTFRTTALYQAGDFDSLQADITDFMTQGHIISSLDIQMPWHTYATEQVIPAENTPSYHGSLLDVPADVLSATVQKLSAGGQVITAISSDGSGGFQVISSSWEGDPTSHYESIVVSSTLSEVPAQFRMLTAQGYVLTAIGGNRNSGMRLVGTRFIGNTVARPTIVDVYAPHTQGSSYDPLADGYVVVGSIFDDSDSTNTVLLQK